MLTKMKQNCHTCRYFGQVYHGAYRELPFTDGLEGMKIWAKEPWQTCRSC